MAHFAKIENGIVTQVIVADQEFIDSGAVGDTTMWIQTSYNTREGIHVLGGTPLRKNYAAVGYSYDEALDAFIPPQPYPSWILNDETCMWNPPTPCPDDVDNSYTWDEATLSWIAQTFTK
jgi:hypothetical protein